MKYRIKKVVSDSGTTNWHIFRDDGKPIKHHGQECNSLRFGLYAAAKMYLLTTYEPEEYDLEELQ